MWIKKILLIMLSVVFVAACSSTTFAKQKKVATGESWLKLSDEKKMAVVSSFISRVENKGVVISKDPALYCERMDDFFAKHPDLRKEPAGKILKTLIIMEYDWTEKGVDKEALAKKWLGEDLYNANRKRLKSLAQQEASQ